MDPMWKFTIYFTITLVFMMAIEGIFLNPFIKSFIMALIIAILGVKSDE